MSELWTHWSPLPGTQCEVSCGPVRDGGPWGPMITPYLRDVQGIAEALGGYVPTPTLLDAMVRASRVRCTPKPRPPNATIEQSEGYSREMDLQLRKGRWQGDEPAYAGGKAFTLSDLPRPNGHYWIYGFWVPVEELKGGKWGGIKVYHCATPGDDLRVIQPPPPDAESCGHNGGHREYPLHLYLVRPRPGVSPEEALGVRELRYLPGDSTMGTSLKLGSTGPAVKDWQRVIGATPDGSFGPQTERLTKLWQSSHGLKADGVVGPVTLAASKAKAGAKPVGADGLVSAFIASPHCNFGARKPSDVLRLVLHSTESSEMFHGARIVAAGFRGDREASAHYCVDDIEIVQCCEIQDVAWTCGAENRTSVSIEMVGRASQTAADWDDAYSRGVRENAAKVAAHVCRTCGIPVRWVDAAGIQRGEKGITTHLEVTRAYQVRGGHVDPGPGFPLEAFIARVRELL
jgi:peptidoglycan hydrolase-like protein with peptidoglycan-binding domain